MTDTNITTQSPDTLAALAALLQQAQGVTAKPAITGWNQPQANNVAPQVLGVSVPLALQTPIGKVRVYLSVGPEHAASPAALTSLLEQLSNAGLPLDAWQPSNQQGNGSSWNNGNGGGYNGYKRRY